MFHKHLVLLSLSILVLFPITIQAEEKDPVIQTMEKGHLQDN